MSLIQLVSQNDNSAEFQVHFADIINIKPNSKVALIDASVYKDLVYNLDHLIELNFTINWGNTTYQGGQAVNYTILTSSFTNKKKVRYQELLDKFLNAISTNVLYQNYFFDGDKKDLGDNVITQLSLKQNHIDAPTNWKTFSGFVGQGASNQNFIAQSGSALPTGSYLNNAIMTNPVPLGYYTETGGGNLPAMASFVPKNDGDNMIIGLSYEDAGDFTNAFFSKGNTPKWNLTDVIMRDMVSGVDYQFKVGADLNNYTIENFATSAVVFTSAVVSSITETSAEIKLTNGANPGGVDCKFAKGDRQLVQLGTTIADAGKGYLANQICQLSGCDGEGGEIEVLTIGAGGLISTFRITKGGQGYNNGDTLFVSGSSIQDEAMLFVDFPLEYVVDCSSIAPLGFQMYYDSDMVGSAEPVYLWGGNGLDIPLGVELTYESTTKIVSVNVFKHKTGTNYKPFNEDNIEPVVGGKFEIDFGSTLMNDIIVEFNVGLNQEIGITIMDGENLVEYAESIKMETDILPTKATGNNMDEGLHLCVFSDIKGSEGAIIYNKKDTTLETKVWTGGVSAEDFDEKQGAEISFKFNDTDKLGKMLGFTELETIIFDGYMDGGLLNGQTNPPRYNSGIVDGDGGETRRLNICVDNLTHQSYKNFSNDNLPSGALNGRQGFKSGTLDKMIGVFPPTDKSYGDIYYEANTPVYVDLNNQNLIQINRLNVSIREYETNKITEDISGSTSLTIHITT